MRILGLDPGLRITGWGMVDAEANRLSFVECGTVTSDSGLSLAERLAQLHLGLGRVICRLGPDEAAVEETFVNRNPASTLKLGQARGVCLLAASQAGLAVGEYTPNAIKKSVVGSGHAAKEQVQMMVRTLLPGVNAIGGAGEDESDALAAAICHAHHRETAMRIKEAAQ